MHWIDILVIVTLLISGAFGYARGFVHEVLSIAGWAGAAFATLYGAPILKTFTQNFIPDPFISALVTGIVLFIATLVILSLITRQISKGVKESALGALDRALGFLFGLLRGALIVCLVWIGYEWTTPPKELPAWVFIARTMPVVIQGADILKSLVPLSEKRHNVTDPKAPPQGRKNSAKKNHQSLLEKAINAIPSAPSRTRDGSYGKKERTEMNRLFETNQ